MFKSEKEMSKVFEKFLRTNHGTSYIKEFEGLFGVPDFVFFDKTSSRTSIIAFELKLNNWKRAAQQAFRYKSFSNFAFVVVTPETAKQAATSLSLFSQYNIGLAQIDSNAVFQIIFKPNEAEPFSDSLRQKVISAIKTSRKKAKNTSLLIAGTEAH